MGISVSDQVHNPQSEWTAEQLKLITDTVARGATSDELKLFLYRCKNMGLDPLKPGAVHFIKYGSNPGTMVVGIDGFRARAARTGKHNGTKRGVLRDEKGKCVGAWAEVYRSDWAHPAREEVSLQEYSTGKSGWAKMPETMIKKVAEVAALRMAFPDDLGGLYSQEEMDQVDSNQGSTKQQLAKPEEKKIEEISESHFLNAPDVASPDYVLTFGKYKGKRLGDMAADEIKIYAEWILSSAARQNRAITGMAAEFMRHAENVLNDSTNQGEPA